MEEHDILEVLETAFDEDHQQHAQLGNNADQKSYSDGAECWHHTGFSSRPANAVPGQVAPQALVIVRGGRDIVYGTRDVRAPGPLLRPGEACMYTCGEDGKGEGRILIRNNNDIEIYSGTLILIGKDAQKSAVLGEPLVEALSTIVQGINAIVTAFNAHTHVCSIPTTPGAPPASPASPLSPPSGLLSETVKVQA